MLRYDDGAETVAELVCEANTVLQASDTIEIAVRDLIAVNAGRLPVIDNAEDRKMVGVVAARDLLRAVNLARINAEAETKGQVKARD